MFRGAILAVMATLGVIVLEFACRALFPYYDPRNQVTLKRNTEGVVTGPPGAHIRHGTTRGEFMIDARFNSHGLREPKPLSAATSNDVFVAGDSFTMGWGVKEEERYSDLLAPRLATPVFNIAIPEDIRGYQAMLGYVQRHGPPIRHLILGLCMENDLWDYSATASTHEEYAKQMHHNPLQRFARLVRGRSALWMTVSYTMRSYETTRKLAEGIGITRNVDQLTHKNDYTPAVLESSRRELMKIATNYNCVVLVIPSRALWHGAYRETEARIHTEFVQSLRASGVKLVDVKGRFEQGGNPLQYYYRTDPHWNPAGHKLAAEALAEFLAADPAWTPLLRAAAARPAP